MNEELSQTKNIGNYKIIYKTFGKNTILTIPKISISIDDSFNFNLINIENIQFIPYDKQIFKINIVCMNNETTINKIIQAIQFL